MGGKKVFELVLEIGHKSSPLNKKLANGYTHKWTAFVKGVNNSKIEHCIQRVVFQLHESFENPYRDISEPPYQIKETGYAGFEIPIQIYFKNKEKPNHLVFVHDLCLLTNKPNDATKQEKIKFINPTKEFERCLIKSGAQLLSVAVKKERSDSPPAKKQKSSSIIPSKDMSKQPPTQPQSQPQPQQQQHHHHHHKSSSQNNHNSSGNHHHSSSGGGSGGGGTKPSHNNHSEHRHHHNNHHSNHHHNHHNNNNNNNNNNNHQQLQNHHQPSSQHQQQSQGQQAAHQQQQQLQQQQGHKSKGSSRDFIDLFGAPLVYNPNSKHPHKHSSSNHKHSSKYDSSKYDSSIKEEPPAPTPPPPPPPIQQKPSPPPPPPPSSKQAAPEVAAPVPVATPVPVPVATPVVATTKEDQYANDLQIIQTKISCLSDCNRLQKIVDIVEEAGEWFNLTSKKFEFDLKRLDRKTLSKIERCLQH